MTDKAGIRPYDISEVNEYYEGEKEDCDYDDEVEYEDEEGDYYDNHDEQRSQADQFLLSAGSWACDTCMVNNPADLTECLACSTPKPGTKPQPSTGAKFSDSSQPSESFGPPAPAPFSFEVPSGFPSTSSAFSAGSTGIGHKSPPTFSFGESAQPSRAPGSPSSGSGFKPASTVGLTFGSPSQPAAPTELGITPSTTETTAPAALFVFQSPSINTNSIADNAPDSLKPGAQSPPTTGFSFGGSKDTGDHAVEDSEYDPHYEPVIALPDKVEVVTGDEGEDVIFKERAKLYRWDAKTKAWKERGVGDMKILQIPETGQARILMRREQVLKVCANHRLAPEMKLEPMLSSDRAWVWLATDFAEGEVSHEKFAIKFKFAESAAEFKEVFDKMKMADVRAPVEGIKGKERVKSGAPVDVGQGGKEKSQEPVSTEGNIEQRFQAADPVVVHSEGDQEDDDDEDYDYDDEEEYRDEDGDYYDNYDGQPSLADQFRPPAGSWTCDTCMVNNPADKTQCMACTALKPVAQPPRATSGFSFGGSKKDVSDLKDKINQGHLIKSPTPDNQALLSQSKSSESPVQPSPFAGFSFKAAGSAGSSGFSTNPAFQSPKLSPETTTAASSPFAGFSFKPNTNQLDSCLGGVGDGTTESATQQYPQVTALLSSGPGTPVEENTDQARPGSQIPESSGRKPRQSPMGLTGVTKSPQKKEDGGITETTDSGSDEDVVLVGERKASPEQIARAERLMLPPHFYLYEDKPPCPGCVGCDEEDLKARVDAAKTPTSQGLGLFGAKPKASPALFSNFPVTGISFASLSADNNSRSGFKKSDSSKPFAFAGPGALVFGSAKQDTGHHAVEDSEYDPHYEPVIALPDKVEVMTGDEGEDVIFKERAKLYRWDAKTKAWKERGVGDMKILQNPETGQARILMRREQVLKVCANHRLAPEMKLEPMLSSDRAWVWLATDFAEEEVSHEKFAIKFRFSESAAEFKEAFDKMKMADVRGAPVDVGQGREEKSQPSLADQFCPPAGSWTCDTCMVNNPADKTQCLACTALKPGAQPPQTTGSSFGGSKPSLADQFCPPAGSWTCDTCMVNNPADKTQCLACTALKPGAQPPQTTGSSFGGSKPSMADQFCPPAGSWTCDTCMVNNPADKTQCLACTALKPGAQPPQTTGSSFGGSKPSLADQFCPPAGSWTCDTCMVNNPADKTQCLACTALKPGAQPPQTTGSSFGGSKPSLADQFCPPAGSWTCDTCMVNNPADKTQCLACTALKPGAQPPQTTGSSFGGSKPSLADQFCPPAGSWTCDTCMVNNPADKTQCLACTALKPGAQPPQTTGSSFGGSKPSGSFGSPAPAPFSFNVPSGIPSTSSAFSAGSTGIGLKSTPAFSFASPQPSGAPGSTASGSGSKLPSTVGFSFGSLSQPAAPIVLGFTPSTTKTTAPAFGFQSPSVNTNSNADNAPDLMVSDSSLGNKAASTAASKPGSQLSPSHSKFPFGGGMQHYSFGSPSQTKQTGVSFGSPGSTPASSTATKLTGPVFGGMPVKDTTTPALGGFSFAQKPSASSTPTKLTGPVFGRTPVKDTTTPAFGGFSFAQKLSASPTPTKLTGPVFGGTPVKDTTTPAFGGFSFAQKPSASSTPTKLTGPVFGGTPVKDTTTPAFGGFSFAQKPSASPTPTKLPGPVFGRTPVKDITTQAFELFSLAQKPPASSTPTKLRGPVFSGTPVKDTTTPAFEGFPFAQKPSDTDEKGDSDDKESSSSFARSGQFSFRLDADNVASYPPKSEDKAAVKSPGPKKSGEYYQSDDDLHLEPVVTLPDVVNLETGEVGEDVKFTHRSKLYRWDTKGKQWKQWGVGYIKVLSNLETKKHRIVMRRDQPSLADQFRPPAGSWTCNTCMINNPANRTECLACSTLKPGAQPQPSTGAKFGDSSQDTGDHAVEDSEYDPHYEPIIALPDKVEVVTGDEGEDVIFKERAKLYRWDAKTKAWKERGVGDMKILQNPETGQARILMRREQVLKVCANHRLAPEMKLEPMLSSDRAWVWLVTDFAEEEDSHEKFAIKFKFAVSAAKFKEAFDKMKMADIRVPVEGIKGKEGVKSGAPEDVGQGREEKTQDTGDHAVEDSEYDPHYEPIIALPDKVEVVTGDEGEDVIFKERAKLYRWDAKTKAWKERGVGDMKILQNPETGQARILMRREQVLKVCANHRLAPEMKLEPMLSSDRAWVWLVTDFAEEEDSHEKFAIKFKFAVSAAKFKEAFDKMKMADIRVPVEGIKGKEGVKSGAPEDVGQGREEKTQDTGDHAVEDSEYDPHYEPIIALPDKVEVVTGDEGEDVIFKERAKLYRWDAKTKAWKERGVGDMKILQNPETGQARILMRREQVLKVCANHRLAPEMKLEPMLSSDRAWVWLVTDFAEEEDSHEKFAIKFKFAVSAAKFKEAFDKMKMADIRVPVEGIKGKEGVKSGAPEDVGQGREEKTQDRFTITTIGSLRKEEELEDILLCSLCGDLLEDAKILECRHRFCKGCLAGVIDDVATDATTLCCPNCQHDQNLPGDGIEGIPGDLCLDEVLRNKKIERDLKNSKKEQVCSACEKLMTAVAICPHCGGFLCDACFSAHDMLRIFKSHGDIVTLDDIETGRETYDGHNISSYAPKPRCSLHEDMILHIHCKTCNKPICLLCEPVCHQSHEIEEIGAAGKRANTRILELLEGSKRKENVLQERAVYITGLTKKYETIISEITQQAENRATSLKESIKKQKKEDLQDLENKRRMIEERAEDKLDEVDRGKKFIIDEMVLMNAFLHQFCRDSGNETRGTLREVRDYQAIAKLVTDDGNNLALLRAVSNIEESLDLGDELEKDSVIRSWDRATPDMSDLSSSSLKDLCWSMQVGRFNSDQLFTKTKSFISKNLSISGAEEDNILSVAAFGRSWLTDNEAQLSLSVVDCDKMKCVSLRTLKVSGIRRVFLAGRDEGHSYTVCVKSDSSSLYRDAVLIDDLKLPSSVLCCVLLPSGGGLLVGVENSVTLYKCNLEAAQVSTMTINDDNLQPPVSLAVAADGKIILCDGNSKALAVSHHGEVNSRFKGRLLTDQPLRVSTDRRGFVYILWMRRQMFTSVVMQYSPKGTLISEIPMSRLSMTMTTMVIGGRDVVVLAGSLGMIQFHEKTSFGEMFGQYVMHREDPEGYQPLSVWLEEWQKATTAQSDTQEETDGNDDDPESTDQEILLTTDIEVKIGQSHEDPNFVNRTGVIREIHGPVCSVVLDGDEVVAVDSKHLEPIKPTKGDKIKFISGEYDGETGLLHKIEDGRDVVYLDSTPFELKYLAVDSIGKLYCRLFGTRSIGGLLCPTESTRVSGTTTGGNLLGSLQMGTGVKFQPVDAQDTMVKNGIQQQIITRHQVITAMEQYKTESFQELRIVDYATGRKGGSCEAIQGLRELDQKKTTCSSFGNQCKPLSGGFTFVSPFGTPASGGFGAPSAFGAAASSTSPFGDALTAKTSGGGFGSQNGFGQSTSTTVTGGGFGSTGSSSSTASIVGTGGFGTPVASTGGGFGSTGFGSSTASSVGTGGFGTPVASTGGGFGSTGSSSSTASIVGTGGFGTPVASTGGGFGSTGFGSSTASSVGTSGFGTPAASPASSGFGAAPLFGGVPAFGSKPGAIGSPPAFGTGAGFSNPLGQSTFGSSPSTGSLYGASANQGSSSGGFGGFASQDTPSFGGITSNSTTGFGSAAQQMGSAFGGGNTGFGASGQTPTSASKSLFGQATLSATTTPSLFGKAAQSAPTSSQSTLGGLGGWEEEVVFVEEKKATEEQIARAERLMLPPHFYLYEDKPPCKGCVGCEEEDFKIEQQSEDNAADPDQRDDDKGGHRLEEDDKSEKGGEDEIEQQSKDDADPDQEDDDKGGHGLDESDGRGEDGDEEEEDIYCGASDEEPSGLFGTSATESPSFKAPLKSTALTSASAGFGVKSTSSFSFGQPAKSIQVSVSTTNSGFKTPSESSSMLSAYSTPSTGFGIKSTSAFSLGKPAEQSQAPGSTIRSGSKMPFSTAGFESMTSQPSSSGVGITSAITCASTTASFSFQSPSSKTNLDGDDVPDSSAGSTTPVSQKESQLSPDGQKKFTFEGNRPKLPFGTWDQSGPKSFSFSGYSEASAPSFAVNAQFSFHLDMDKVVSSPPRTTDKSTIQSPGLERSGEFYQSDELDDLHFGPVVILPEVVQLETGEEDEEVRFTHRAKLYRWDSQEEQWKERGVGDIKVLYHPETKKYRIVMRREQVLKVCANHFITRHMDLQPKSGSYRSWVWNAMDASDGEVLRKQLAVRFETDDAANEFKEVVETAKEDSLEDEIEF